jgi:hypothetical protein
MSSIPAYHRVDRVPIEWSREEEDILVQLTRDQLALEAKDKTKEIPWADHWRSVSTRLYEKGGYSRTPNACSARWTKTVNFTKSCLKAALPTWVDAETQILIQMTIHQIGVEKSDPSMSISWSQHWKSVSKKLEDHGFQRSMKQCDALWSLVHRDCEAEGELTVASIKKVGF